MRRLLVAAILMAGMTSAAAAAPDLCVRDVLGIWGEKDVATCEAFVAGGQGTPRQISTALVNLGHAYRFKRGEMGKGTTAREYWMRAAAVDPTYAEPHVMLGDLALGGENPELALPHYERAVNLDPRHWRALMGPAKVWSSLQRHDQAIAQGRLAVAAAPDVGVAHQVFGEILKRAKRLEEATAEFKLATIGYDETVQREPGIWQQPSPWNDLAALLVLRGDFAEAEKAISQTIDGRPETAITPTDLLERGKIYEELKRPRDAANDYERAARLLGPDYPEIQTYITRAAMLRAESGEERPARAMFDDILRAGKLQSILRLQVYLRNNGFDDVKIDGKVSPALEAALDDCLVKKGCIEAFGQPI